MILWRVGGFHHIKKFSLVVAPGVLFPHTSEWFDELGKAIQFEVVFTYGKTEDLPSNLAQYLTDHNLAQKTRIIV